MAYKNPKNCLERICVGGEREKGIWALPESFTSVFCGVSVQWLHSGCFFPLLDRAMSKAWQVVLVVAGVQAREFHTGLQCPVHVRYVLYMGFLE